MNSNEYSVVNIMVDADVITEAAPHAFRATPHYSITISIGCDHTAELVIDEEALRELCDRNILDFDLLVGERLR